MAAILTTALIRPSDGKVVKVNADEVIFYTQRGWKLADDKGKTSGGEQPKVEQPKVEQPKETTGDNQNLNDVII